MENFIEYCKNYTEVIQAIKDRVEEFDDDGEVF